MPRSSLSATRRTPTSFAATEKERSSFISKSRRSFPAKRHAAWASRQKRISAPRSFGCWAAYLCPTQMLHSSTSSSQPPTCRLTFAPFTKGGSPRPERKVKITKTVLFAPSTFLQIPMPISGQSNPTVKGGTSLLNASTANTAVQGTLRDKALRSVLDLERESAAAPPANNQK